MWNLLPIISLTSYLVLCLFFAILSVMRDVMFEYSIEDKRIKYDKYENAFNEFMRFRLPMKIILFPFGLFYIIIYYVVMNWKNPIEGDDII